MSMKTSKRVFFHFFQHVGKKRKKPRPALAKTGIMSMLRPERKDVRDEKQLENE